MRTTTILACGTLALFAACRSSDNNNGTDAGSGSGGSNGGAVTIQDVQSTNMPAGTPVSLKGVVVTTIDAYGAKTGDLWVEEPEGGQYSGVHVYNAPLTMVASLAPGDIVDITGAEKSEFALSSDTTGRTLTELEPISGGMMAVTKTGTGSLPPIAQVDALMIGQLSDTNNNGQRSAAWGAWEGVLIQLTNVSAFGSPKCVGSACNDMTDQQFSITGDAEVESEMAAFPSGIALDTCLGSVTGVVDYFFDYLILPRTTADVTTGGTGCTFENAATGGTVCTDGVDNDGNGFTDCQDLGCEVGSAAWLGTSCVGTGAATCGCSANEAANAGAAAVQAVTGTTKTAMILNSVYVTAVAKTGYWVADTLTSTKGHGAFVFSSTAPVGTIVVGASFTVQGIGEQFGTGSGASAQTIAELEDPTVVGTITAPGTAPTALAVSTTDFPTAVGLTTGGPWAGNLVSLTGPFIVTVAPNSFNEVTLSDNNGVTFTVDDGAFYQFGTGATPATTPALNTCFSTLTGVMDLQTSAQIRTLNPRSAADMPTTTGTVHGTTCN